MVNNHSDSVRITRCCHIGYSFRIAARFVLYAPSHRQDSAYHDLCYNTRGAMGGTINVCVYVCMYVLMYDYIYVLFVCRG